ncbi:MAG: cobyrinate a,c-diamide synthase [Marinifilaceae bacterium]|nr:cobyrinate a,c-diamide synthase [Marinifilaceae bacterium]
MKKIQFLIGASSLGSGKTTLAMGLMRALARKGITVQPFKCGPDYIDTRHHYAATGRTSVNLDTFLSTDEHLKELYSRYGSTADACVIEGTMGLYDGYAIDKGSSADTAMLLDLPVILVVKAKSVAYSVGPILYGLKNFRPGLKIAGVIFNFVSSEKHYNLLKQAAEAVGVTSLGYLKQESALEIPIENLGLNIDEEFCFNEFADLIASAMESTVDIEKIINICTQEFAETEPQKPTPRGTLKITVARDEAFNFYYEENIKALKRYGKVKFFSPIHDTELPETDFLYLPGGYPELHLPELTANKKMMASIRAYCKNGGKVLAECGGMIYLSESVTDKDGKNFDMAAVLPRKITLDRVKLTLGYRKVVAPDGKEWRGHEFHFSKLLPGESADGSYLVYNAKGELCDSEILRIDNVIATYIHIYWGDSDKLPFDL